MKLKDVAAVLGTAKGTASMLRAGKYDREGSDLPARYAALVALIEQERQSARADAVETAEAEPDTICFSCPREDCTGCRVAEIEAAPVRIR